MLREEKKNKRIIKLIIALFIIIIESNVFALDEKMGDDYFNNLIPNNHINHYNSVKGTIDNNTINFDNIDVMVHCYNPEVLNDWNSWENNKSSQDVYEDYMDAADRLYDSASSQDSEMQEGMMYAQADAMRIQADKNVSDSYVNFLTYYLKEKKLILDTKVFDINYQKSVYDLQNAKATYEEALRKEDSANNAMIYGSGTRVDYLSAKKAVSDAKASMLNIESSAKNYKRNLLINCGKTMDEDIYITPVFPMTNFDINSINLQSDYEKALKNNIQYEIYKRKKNNARTDEVKKEYEILVDAAPQNIYTDLELKYSNIIDLIDSINNRNIALELATSNFNKAKNEYESGKISKKEYETVKYNLEVAKNNLMSIGYDLNIAILKYNASVEGLGEC